MHCGKPPGTKATEPLTLPGLGSYCSGASMERSLASIVNSYFTAIELNLHVQSMNVRPKLHLLLLVSNAFAQVTFVSSRLSWLLCVRSNKYDDFLKQFARVSSKPARKLKRAERRVGEQPSSFSSGLYNWSLLQNHVFVLLLRRKKI